DSMLQAARPATAMTGSSTAAWVAQWLRARLLAPDTIEFALSAMTEPSNLRRAHAAKAKPPRCRTVRPVRDDGRCTVRHAGSMRRPRIRCMGSRQISGDAPHAKD